MTKNTIERQNLIEALNTLPDEALTELASFVEYLRHKTHPPKTSVPSKTNFLLTIAGLGESGQSNVSDSTDRRDFSIARPAHCDYFELFP